MSSFLSSSICERLINFEIIYRKRGESLRQVERFFLCVRAIMSIHLRFFIFVPIVEIKIIMLNIFISSLKILGFHNCPCRSMTIKTLEDFVDYMRTYMVGWSCSKSCSLGQTNIWKNLSTSLMTGKSGESVVGMWKRFDVGSSRVDLQIW